MSVIYYYANNANLDIFLKYGIRLSKNFDVELNLNGYVKPFLIGFLNPKDDRKKYDSDKHTCIKLDLLDSHLKIVDKSTITNYNNSQIDFIPINEYIFGTYKNPLVLIDTSVISDKITLYNKVIDIPLLFDNSEDFYYDIQIEEMMNKLSKEEVYNLLNNHFQNKT